MPAPRVLVVTDLSQRTRDVLGMASGLRRRWGVALDAYYLWSVPHVGADASDSDRTLAALDAFATDDGAWDVLDVLGAKERAGELSIRGYLVRSATGRRLVDIAVDAGYVAVLDGTVSPMIRAERFDMHAARSSGIARRASPLLGRASHSELHTLVHSY